MIEYVEKRKKIKALQYTKDNPQECHELLWDLGYLTRVYGADLCFIDPDDKTSRTIRLGSYLVIVGGLGRIEIMTERQFEHDYEPLEEVRDIAPIEHPKRPANVKDLPSERILVFAIKWGNLDDSWIGREVGVQANNIWFRGTINRIDRLSGDQLLGRIDTRETYCIIHADSKYPTCFTPDCDVYTPEDVRNI